MMGISACATMSPAIPLKPSAESPVPVESGQGSGVEKSQEKSRPKPKPKRKSDAEIESEKNWDLPSVDSEDPSDDCMEIDYDKPGACDLV